MQKEVEEAVQGRQNAEEKAKKAATEVGTLTASSLLPSEVGAVAKGRRPICSPKGFH